MMATGAEFDVVEVGVLQPRLLSRCDALRAGDVGYIAASHQERCTIRRVGDTITDDANARRRAAARLPEGEPDGVLRHLSGGRRKLRRPARTRWKSCSSTTPR